MDFQGGNLSTLLNLIWAERKGILHATKQIDRDIQMSVLTIDHFNFTAPMDKLDQVKDFYTNVLGFTVGPRPNFNRNGYWLYANERALIHLIEGNGTHVPDDCTLNHIALKISDLETTIDALNAHKVPFKTSEVKDRGQTQLFFKDPVGLGIELNYSTDMSR